MIMIGATTTIEATIIAVETAARSLAVRFWG